MVKRNKDQKKNERSPCFTIIHLHLQLPKAVLMKRLTLLVVVVFIGLNNCFSQPLSRREQSLQAEKIREACRHAWHGYKTYAWGYDALKPVSKTGYNWYKRSFLMTPVDAFDTFILLGMKKEAAEAKKIIFSELSFDLDVEVQFFEMNIRLVGGLLSAYDLTGEKRFLELAADLGRRLLPVFNSATGMPYRYVNLKTGKSRGAVSNPAEIGTCMLEFGKLTQYTKDSLFFKTAKKAALEVFRRRSDIDLVGTTIDVNTGEWKNTESQIGACIDSYYEYLFKTWLLFGDKECKAAWEIHNKAILKRLYTETIHGSYFTRVDFRSGRETNSWYGALDAFYPGILVLSGEIATARKIQQGNFHMWTAFNLEPETFDFITDSIVEPAYPLRPENIESCFYLYRSTKDPQYQRMGQRMINDIISKCRTHAGFAALKNVVTLEKEDSMESFFFAETLKYAYLLFAPDSTLDLKKWVFNTEAHPMKIVKW